MDIALKWDPDFATGDLFLDGFDLATDSGLRTSVVISLMTDRTLTPTDSPGEPWDGDRGGWWGDMPFGFGDNRGPIGSRLRLLRRAKRTQDTLRRAEAYAKESLAWMIEDGVANQIEISAAWYGDHDNQLGLTVKISRRDPKTGDTSTSYSFVWENS